MSYTLNEGGDLLTETVEGVTMPVDFKFSTVNDFVHNTDTDFNDLQCLCLGMAVYIEKLENRAKTPMLAS